MKQRRERGITKKGKFKHVPKVTDPVGFDDELVYQRPATIYGLRQPTGEIFCHWCWGKAHRASSQITSRLRERTRCHGCGARFSYIEMALSARDYWLPGSAIEDMRDAVQDQG